MNNIAEKPNRLQYATTNNIVGQPQDYRSDIEEFVTTGTEPVNHVLANNMSQNYTKTLDPNHNTDNHNVTVNSNKPDYSHRPKIPIPVNFLNIHEHNPKNEFESHYSNNYSHRPKIPTTDNLFNQQTKIPRIPTKRPSRLSISKDSDSTTVTASTYSNENSKSNTSLNDKTLERPNPFRNASTTSTSISSNVPKIPPIPKAPTFQQILDARSKTLDSLHDNDQTIENGDKGNIEKTYPNLSDRQGRPLLNKQLSKPHLTRASHSTSTLVVRTLDNRSLTNFSSEGDNNSTSFPLEKIDSADTVNTVTERSSSPNLSNLESSLNNLELTNSFTSDNLSAYNSRNDSTHSFNTTNNPFFDETLDGNNDTIDQNNNDMNSPRNRFSHATIPMLLHTSNSISNTNSNVSAPLASQPYAVPRLMAVSEIDNLHAYVTNNESDDSLFKGNENNSEFEDNAEKSDGSVILDTHDIGSLGSDQEINNENNEEDEEFEEENDLADIYDDLRKEKIKKDKEERKKIKKKKKKIEKCQYIAFAILSKTYYKTTYKEYADFLGTQKNHRILTAFISLLKPFSVSLLECLILLSNTIYLIAEAQNLDRILEELSKQWKDMFTESVYAEHFELIHIVLFSLLILNSNLHHPIKTQERMKNNSGNFDNIRKVFIEDTIYAMQKEAERNDYSIKSIESAVKKELTGYFEVLKREPLPLFVEPETKPAPEKRTLTKSLKKRRTQLINKSISLISMQALRSRENFTQATLPPPPTTTSTIIEENPVLQVPSRASINFQRTSGEFLCPSLPFSLLYKREDIDVDLIEQNYLLWCIDGIVKLKSSMFYSSGGIAHSTDRKTNNLPYSRSSVSSFSSITLSTTFSNTEDDYDIAHLREKRNTRILPTTLLKKGETIHTPAMSAFSNIASPRSSTSSTESSSSMTGLTIPAQRHSMVENRSSSLKDSSLVLSRIFVYEGRLFFFKTNSKELFKIDIESASTYKKYPIYFVITLVDAFATFTADGKIRVELLTFFLESPSTIASSKLRAHSNPSSNSHSSSTRSKSNQNSSHHSHSYQHSYKHRHGHKHPLEQENETIEFEVLPDIAQDYADCINFWAARITKIKILGIGSMTNDEFGWSSGILDGKVAADDNVEIRRWNPMTGGVSFHINKNVSFFECLQEWTNFRETLNALIYEHEDLKSTIKHLWRDNRKQYKRVLYNWNERYNYLKKQQKRCDAYIEVLQLGEYQLLEYSKNNRV